MSCDCAPPKIVLFQAAPAVPRYPSREKLKASAGNISQLHMNLPGGWTFMKIAAEDKSYAQGNGNRSQKQVTHIHCHLQQTEAGLHFRHHL